MIYRFETIYRDLLLRLGESSDLPPRLGPGEDYAGIPAVRLVKSLLPGIAAEVLSSAPVELIDTTLRLTASPEPLGVDFGRLLLPADFLRLSVFQMPDWPEPISEIPDEKGEFTLIGALGGSAPLLLRRMRTPRRPWLRPVRCGERIYLHFYGTAFPDHMPRLAEYIGRPRWRADASIRLPEALYPLIVESLATKAKERWLTT